MILSLGIIRIVSYYYNTKNSAPHCSKYAFLKQNSTIFQFHGCLPHCVEVHDRQKGGDGSCSVTQMCTTYIGYTIPENHSSFLFRAILVVKRYIYLENYFLLSWQCMHLLVTLLDSVVYCSSIPALLLLL